MLEERTQPTGAYISYTTYFVLFFILIITPFGILNYIRPDLFIFATHICDLLSRLPIATPFRDSHSQLHFATHIRDSRSRLTFATHIRDSRSRPHSRLHFTTRARDHTRDSCSRLPIALPPATRSFCRDFRRATPPRTDGLC